MSVINTIIMSDQQESTALLKKVLTHTDYMIIFEGTSLQQQAAAKWLIEPDLIIVIKESIEQDILEQLKAINEQFPLPMVIFTKNDHDDAIDNAIEAGVSAYIVDGLTENRIIPILRTACARFKQQQKVYKQVEDLKTNLAERKVIDRAKGIVMQQRQCSEDDAYKLLRTTAMQQNVRIAVLAKNIVDTSTLLHS